MTAIRIALLTALAQLAENPHERLLDEINQLAKSPEDVSHAEAPSADANRVDEEVYQQPVRAHENEENTKVSPLLACLDVQS